MKILLAATAVLAMSGSALAYQSYSTQPSTRTQTHTTHTTTTTTAPAVAVIDPNVVFVAPAGWTAEQRALWEAQMDFHPGWTADQVAAFEAMMAIPPASWTPEQQALYAEHINHIPPDWTDAQRATFASMIEPVRTPWLSTTQTAEVDTTTTTTVAPTTLAQAPASGPVVQPSNADPEHDARGIAVISAEAFVPPGYNLIPSAGAMGGPVEGSDATYPPCTAELTDNCTQTYEVGSNPD